MSDNKPLPRILCPVCGSTWIEYGGVVGSDRHQTDSYKCNGGHMFSITTDIVQRYSDGNTYPHQRESAGVEERNASLQHALATIPESTLQEIADHVYKKRQHEYTVALESVNFQSIGSSLKDSVDEQFRSAADAIEFESKAKKSITECNGCRFPLADNNPSLYCKLCDTAGVQFMPNTSTGTRPVIAAINFAANTIIEQLKGT